MAIDFLELPGVPQMIAPPETAEDLFYRNEMMRATEKIIEDKFVDSKLKDFPLWSIATKSLKLTFFEERDIPLMENLFEAEVCNLLRSIPSCEHNSSLYLMIGQCRMIFLSNLRRAVGTNNRDKLNERISLLSQIKQIISSGGSSMSSGGGGMGGFFRRVAGR